MIRRRVFNTSLLAATVAGATAARAQDPFPNRPIRLVVGLAPGGIADITARIVAPRLSEVLGQPVVVENRTGAGGAIATRAVAASAPDGHTLLVAFDGTHVTIPAANAAAGFDPVADFAPIGKIVDAPVLITAHPSFPANDFAEFIGLSRRVLTMGGGPRIFDYGTAGVGSTGHLTMELLKLRLGLFAVHIPYRGGGDARAQVLGRQIPLMLAAVPTTSGDIRAGVLKGLAVTSAKRSPVLPHVPTLAELPHRELKGLDVNSWVGLVAPARTPATVVARLDAALRQTLATEEVSARLLQSGATPVRSSPEIFSRQIAADFGQWKRVVTESKLRLDA
ncbi:MAG TPA: tripartite tricarboxylate transporter substrate-binding protein [Ramlibacter sp.]|jgi:tripartite-type tricarboxylate transporter receptor subunit TctC|uniref:Bug family tripartite tricarboxylate transporter substrate binding protein n=1 Tax=Ramlibacter sp. TaxID=1917967 RepID=UPI002D5CD2C2|nr:tripartite tricarboxylate transporter substrate-binding protein [Ramlibacter sp.]HZY20188.1 tripartite tricarboxylate transporter substrate-binding protein [Ramlibacter sp.]